MRKIYTLLLFYLFVTSSVSAATWYVRKDATGNGTLPNNAFGTLASAIAAASAGDKIDIGPGSFSEKNIVVDKQLTIRGVLDKTRFESTTGGTFITFTAPGTSGQRMVVQNIITQGYARVFSDVNSYTDFSYIEIYGSFTDSSLWSGDVVTFAHNANSISFSYMNIGDYWGMSSAGAYDPNVGNGAVIFKIANDRLVNNIFFANVNFRNVGYGFYAAQSTFSSTSDASTIAFTNCSFSQVKVKGIYAEKLSGLNVSGCSFNKVGQTISGHPGAIDVNLKWKTYYNDISITNSSFEECSNPNSGSDLNGAAIMIKARDFGSYGTNKAAWNGNLTIDKCYFDKNNASIRIGESNEGNGTGTAENSSQNGNMTISNNVFLDNSGTIGTYNGFDIRNLTTGSISLNYNYFKKLGSVITPTVGTSFTQTPISDVNPNGGTVTINSTNTAGQYITEVSVGNYQGYESLTSAITAVEAGRNIYLLDKSSSGFPTLSITKSMVLNSPFEYVSFGNINISNAALLTIRSPYVETKLVTITDGRYILPAYVIGEFEQVATSTNGYLRFGSTVCIASIEMGTVPQIEGSIPYLLDFGNDMLLQGNLTVRNLLLGGELNIGANTLTIQEALVGYNSGDIIGDLGTVNFQSTLGLNKMLLDMDDDNALKNLTINNIAGLEISDQTRVLESTTLSNGDIYLTEGGELIFGPAATFTSGTGRIVVNNEQDGGVVKLYSNTNKSFTFPMATYTGTTKNSVQVGLDLASGVVYQDDFLGTNVGRIYLNIKKGLNANAPVGTTKYVPYSWKLEEDDLSNLSYTAVFKYAESSFSGGLTETEVVPYRYNPVTNPNVKRYVTSNGLVKDPAADYLTITDTKLGEFMFLADDGSTPTSTPDHLVINETKAKGYATIQAAVNDADNNNVIQVAGGTFVERVNVNKPLTIRGNNATYAPWNWAKPATVIIPPSTDFTTGLLTISSMDVTIDGIRFDGVNNALSDAASRIVNGQFIRCNSSIVASLPTFFSGTVANCDIMNFSGRGISVGSTSGGGSAYVYNNRLDNIAAINNGTAIAIFLNNLGGTVQSNRITRADEGFLYQATYTSTFNPLEVKQNQLNVYRSGIRAAGFNNSSSTQLTVSVNNITKADLNAWTADGLTRPTQPTISGINVSNLYGTQNVLLKDNTIYNVKNGIFARGITAYGPNPNRFLVQGGSLTDNIIGIWIYNTGVTYGTTRAIVSGSNIVNSKFIGIIVEDETSTGLTFSDLAFRDGVQVIQTGTIPSDYKEAIQVYGQKARISSLGDTKISGATDNFIRIISPAMNGLTVDGKDVTYDGTVNGQTFNNYKPSANYNLTLRNAVKARIFDGETTGNTTAGVVTIPTTLPVSLIDFNATLKSTGALITWSTSSELNNKNFVIEKSLDGKEFKLLKSVDGKGTTSTKSSYQFTDVNFSQSAYYRLTQIDNNGDATIYNDMIRYVKALGGIEKLTVYPNPATDKISARLPNAKLGALVKLLDLNGKVVATKTATSETIEFNLQGLPTGIYIVQYNDGIDSQTAKVVKQ